MFPPHRLSTSESTSASPFCRFPLPSLRFMQGDGVSYRHIGIKKEPEDGLVRLPSGSSLSGGYLLSHLRSTIGVTGLNFSVR
ncbi:MAG TPA: hypothetical protein H9859_00245, partial [Candidatus Barnesiella excrementigallinarum]|nr:hypothetical protein [Candidatus Barnesiella excrementigallinarum]